MDSPDFKVTSKLSRRKKRPQIVISDDDSESEVKVETNDLGGVANTSNQPEVTQQEISKNSTDADTIVLSQSEDIVATSTPVEHINQMGKLKILL